jgi:hypothetical protein
LQNTGAGHQEHDSYRGTTLIVLAGQDSLHRRDRHNYEKTDSKKNSDVPLSSSACLKLPRICVHVISKGEIKGSGGGDGINGFKNGAVDIQHRTEVEGSMHPCTKGHHSKKGFLQLAHTHIITIY